MSFAYAKDGSTVLPPSFVSVLQQKPHGAL